MTSKARAVLYVRLSRESAVSTSIEGQNADLYALAAREGWQIVATYEDTGKSGGRQRDKARAALDMLRDNEADVLAVYAYDRWSRMGIADSAEVINTIYERQRAAKKGRAPAPLFYAAREGIRSDQEGWEIRVAFAADVAQKERDRMVARRTASIERMRAQGRNPGNGPAPFGYRSAPFADGRPGRRFVIDPTEAEIVREYAPRLIAGESASAVARELNARSVPMPRSEYRLAMLKQEAAIRRGEQVDPSALDGLSTGVWSSSRVSQIWVSEHLLGRSIHRTNRSEAGGSRTGTPVLDPATGLPLQAFEPVLDLATMQALRARFEANVGRGRQRQRRAARLLSGLVFCGHCGERVYVLTTGEYSYYRCGGPGKGVKCTAPRMKASMLEELVEERYLSTYGPRRASSVIEQRASAEVDEEIAALTQQISAVAAQLADEDADVPALLASRASLLSRRSAIKDLAPEISVVRIDHGKTWAEMYAEADMPARRGYLADAYDHVALFAQQAEERVKFYDRPSRDEAPDYYGQ